MVPSAHIIILRVERRDKDIYIYIKERKKKTTLVPFLKQSNQ